MQTNGPIVKGGSMSLKRLFTGFILIVTVWITTPSSTEASIFVSKEQELAYGEKYTAQLSSQIIPNDHLTKLGQDIIKKFDGVPKYNYRFYEIKQSQINAFSAPGGNIFVCSGLLKFLKSDDELVFVLGHEVGHQENEDWRSAINKLMGEVVTNDNGSIHQYIYQLANVINTQGYGMDKEWQADEAGFEFLVRNSEYSLGGGAVSFARVLELENGMQPNKAKSFHPNTEKRIQNQLDYIDQYTGNVMQITLSGDVLINNKIIYSSEDYKKTYYNAGHVARLIHNAGLNNITFRISEVGDSVLADNLIFYESTDAEGVLAQLGSIGCNILKK